MNISWRERLHRGLYKDDEPLLVWLMVVLTFGAGLIDAFCIVSLGHVFVANMTGNFVFLGVSLPPYTKENPDITLAAIGGYCVSAVFAGIFTRSALSQWNKLKILSLLQVVLFVIAYMIWMHNFDIPYSRYTMVFALSLCMGIQAVMVHSLNLDHLPVTLLTRVIMVLCSNKPRKVDTARQFLTLFFMVLGAACGARLCSSNSLLTLYVYLVILVGCTIGILVSYKHLHPASIHKIPM